MSEDRYASWRKSSYSSGTGNCVEVAGEDRLVAIRDTRQGGRGPMLEFTEVVWRAFIAEAKSDEKGR
jgi:hypothetical protein